MLIYIVLYIEWQANGFPVDRVIVWNDMVIHFVTGQPYNLTECPNIQSLLHLS